MLKENGQINQSENLRFLVESLKNNPDRIASSMVSVDRKISRGVIARPEDENGYIDRVLEYMLPTTRIHDDELRPHVKKVLDGRNKSGSTRSAGSGAVDEHSLSIEHMIREGGEAPSDNKGKHRNERANNDEKDGLDHLSDYEYFLFTGERRDK